VIVLKSFAPQVSPSPHTLMVFLKLSFINSLLPFERRSEGVDVLWLKEFLAAP
jgi:hypothetical protein